MKEEKEREETTRKERKGETEKRREKNKQTNRLQLQKRNLFQIAKNTTQANKQTKNARDLTKSIILRMTRNT